MSKSNDLNIRLIDKFRDLLYDLKIAISNADMVLPDSVHKILNKLEEL